MTKSHTPTLSGLSLLIFIRPPENRVFLNHALGLCTELVPNACVSRQTNTTARTLLPVPANCPATTSTQTGLCSSPQKAAPVHRHTAVAEAASQKDASGNWELACFGVGGLSLFCRCHKKCVCRQQQVARVRTDIVQDPMRGKSSPQLPGKPVGWKGESAVPPRNFLSVAYKAGGGRKDRRRTTRQVMSIWGAVGNFLVKDSLMGLQARPPKR